jgi:myo-inositol-1(or 4)-monophosphatase
MNRSLVKKIARKAIIGAGKTLSDGFRRDMYNTAGIEELALLAARSAGNAMSESIIDQLPFEVAETTSQFSVLKNGREELILVHLDGAEGYVYGQPNYALGIAYLKNGEISLAGVFNPFYKELFFAEIEKGLKRNNQKTDVNEVSRLDESFLGFSYRGAYDERGQAQLSKLFQIMRQPVRAMIPGSDLFGLSLLANGNLTGVLIASPDLRLLQPGLFIVEAAGGKITDEHGAPVSPSSQFVIATNGKIHSALLEQFEASMLV